MTMTSRSGRRGLGFAVAVAAVLVASESGLAGDHWLSKSTETRISRRSKIADTDLDHGVRLFDVVVSLYRRPAGDSSRATLDERTPYEAIVERFAEGVYEQSNGWHRIRKVRIYTGGRFADRADVVWTNMGHPCATVGGIGTTGHIQMFDVFEEGRGAGANLDFLTGDARNGGYTLAHEWGHYAYGLYDEYQGKEEKNPGCSLTFHPCSSDAPVHKALMSSQWVAVGGDLDALNHSTRLNSVSTNAQRRVYGASCWDTLVRPPEQDTEPDAATARPARPYWPELGLGAPIPTAKPSIELGSDPSLGRRELQIIWMEDTIVYQLVIDRSGSMLSENKIQNAKSAAKLLVDQAEVGSTRVGIVAFDSTAQVLFPLTLVDGEASKTAMKDSIDGIVASGGTSIGAAADLAMDGLEALPGTADSRIVFVLTDGVSGDDALGPIPRYQEAEVPIFTFAYGSDADATTLRTMADATRGETFTAPSGLAAISNAFQRALARTTTRTTLDAGHEQVAPSATFSSGFAVDSTLAALSVVATYSGSPSAASPLLRSPTGAEVAPVVYEQSGSETLCRFAVGSPASGIWSLEVRSNGPATTLDYNVSALPAAGVTYSASIACVDGEVVRYPRPMLVLARLEKGEPIMGAAAAATVTTPSGATLALLLRDDGAAPDEAASDGTYSGSFVPVANGTHRLQVRFENPQGTAARVRSVVGSSADQTGVAPVALPLAPVGEDFSRTAEATVEVEGVVSDDHGDDVANATALGSDGASVPGRIDRQGDVDVFAVSIPATGHTRWSLHSVTQEMDPSWRMLDAGGSVLGTGTSTGTVEVRGVPFAKRYFEVATRAASVPAGYGVRAQSVATVGSLVVALAKGASKDSARPRGDKLTLAGRVTFEPGATADYARLVGNGLRVEVGGFEQSLIVNLPPGGWTARGAKRIFRSPAKSVPKIKFVLNTRDGAFTLAVSALDLPALPPAVAVEASSGEDHGLARNVWVAKKRGRSLPANSGVAALPLDAGPVAGEIVKRRGAAWWQIVVPRTTQVELAVAAQTLVAPTVALYDHRAETEVAHGDAADAGVVLTASLEPGVYFVRVASENPSARGTFTVAAVDLTRHPKAEPVAVADAFVTRQVAAPGGLVRLRFDVAATARHAVETLAGTLGGTGVRMYGPDDGSVLLAADEPASGSAAVTRTLRPGTYYVEVRGGSASAMGDFQVRVRQVGAPAQTLVVDGPGASASVSPAEPVALFVFTVPSAGSRSVETTSGTLSDTFLTLYGPDDPTLFVASDDDSGVGLASLVTAALAPGTYFVEVRAYSSSSSGTFTISAR